jgi:hypothetical protein
MNVRRTNMEITKGVSIPNLTLKDYVDNQRSCCLCGGELVFKHHTDYLTLTVMEECGCPSCGIKNNPTEYTLQ